MGGTQLKECGKQEALIELLPVAKRQFYYVSKLDLPFLELKPASRRHDHRTKNKSKTTSLYSLNALTSFRQEIEDEMVCFLCVLMLSHAHPF